MMMDYQIQCSGRIDLRDCARRDRVLDALRRWRSYTESMEVYEYSDASLEVYARGKYYKQQLEKFCVFVATLDPKAVGDLKCKGDDWEDLWRIRIRSGRVWVERGDVRYVDPRRFRDSRVVLSAHAVLRELERAEPRERISDDGEQRDRRPRGSLRGEGAT